MYRLLSPLIVLVPQVYFTRKSVDCVACCICHFSAWFRQDHGFDPPCGSQWICGYDLLKSAIPRSNGSNFS